jgi:Tfp pilus assembly protein PilX
MKEPAMKKNTTNLTRSNEKGVALVFTLFLMASLSALAVSLMFLSQTETSSTRNYRTMSQARYAGEAGVHKAINYLTSTAYVPPGSFSNYNLTVSPVTCISGAGCAVVNGPVVLSSMTGVSSNYPDTTVATAFNTAVQGTLAVGTGTVTYGASARLMAMRQVVSYGGGTGTIQTWEITAAGTVPGAMPAIVEVTALLERTVVDAQTFAVFATGTGCGAISMNGNAGTGSYDSATGISSLVDTGGNLGTNGNLTIVGSVDVHGSLSSPRPGVGSCINGSGVTALTQTGAAHVDTGVVQLPQPLNFETPALPSPRPPTTAQTTCAQIGVTLPATCNTVTTPGYITIDPMGSPTPVRLGNISGNFVLRGGNYAINSIGSGNLKVETSLAGSSSVTINLVGKMPDGVTDMPSPFDLNGNAVVNGSMDPSKLQILYAGTGTIDMHGGTSASYLLYAPNANLSTHGNSDIYGSLLVKTLQTAGNTRFFYDKKLDRTAVTMGNYVMSAFSWKKY